MPAENGHNVLAVPPRDQASSSIDAACATAHPSRVRDTRLSYPALQPSISFHTSPASYQEGNRAPHRCRVTPLIRQYTLARSALALDTGNQPNEKLRSSRARAVDRPSHQPPQYPEFGGKRHNQLAQRALESAPPPLPTEPGSDLFAEQPERMRRGEGHSEFLSRQAAAPIQPLMPRSL